MRTFVTPFLVITAIMLSACQTSSLTEVEQAPVPVSNIAFSGEAKQIDKSQSVIAFVGKSNLVNHEGKFNEYSATVTLDKETPADLEKASITAEIDITSVVVDAEGLQGHLLKEDFFSTELHPKATFVSTSVVSKGENLYDVTGDLTIKGVTKSITLTAEITDDYLTAHYELPRADFGIGNDTYGEKLLEPTVPVDIKLVFQS
jgi:polyisoprenoid-binding protein YceI